MLSSREERTAARASARTASRLRVPGASTKTVASPSWMTWVALCDGAIYESRRYEMEAVDRFGTGDAWDAGFFYGYLTRRDPQYAVEFAGAMCALAHTIPGDVALVTVPEVEAVMSGQALDVRR